MESFEHHRIDLEGLLEKTSASGIEIEEIQNASRFCRFLGTQEDSNAFFDSPSTSDEVISGFQQRLFDVAVSGFEDGDTRAPDLRRSASALRLLYNAGNLSKRLKQTLPPDCLRLFRALLRIKELRPEVIAVIFQLSEKLHTVHALDDEYNKLLGELVLLWEKDGNERQWIDALLMTRLEDDGAFLAHAFADFEPAHFLALLNVADVFLEAKLEVHNNNVQFVSDLILRIFYDFENEELGKGRLDFYLESLLYATKIIGSCAVLDRYGKEMSSIQLVGAVRKLLECVVDAEAVEELANPTPQKMAPDRPSQPVMSRRQLVLESTGLQKLSALIGALDSARRAALKRESIAALGNLSAISADNRIEAGKDGGVLLVLSCAKLMPDEKSFIIQWCITALRFMCLGCPENQMQIANIDDKPTGVIDRARLLENLGLKCDVGDDGKVKISNV